MRNHFRVTRPATLHEVFLHHRLFASNWKQWRLVDPPILGEVNGLPTLRGWLLATDGILALVEREDGTAFADGHLDWFIPDTRHFAQFEEVKRSVRPPDQAGKTSKIVEDLLTL